jgi:hypothetical protein
MLTGIIQNETIGQQHAIFTVYRFEKMKCQASAPTNISNAITKSYEKFHIHAS